MSIRYKLFLLFSIVIGLAAGLAAYGIHALSVADSFLVRLYDGPLMGINHARSAHAQLNEARALMQQGLLLRDSMSAKLPGKLADMLSRRSSPCCIKARASLSWAWADLA